MATVLRRVLENSPEPALGDVPIMPALRSVPKCRHRVCLRRPRPAASLRILAGSDPSAWRRWLDLLDVRGSWLVWDGGIPRPPAGGRALLRRFAPCVLRWKTLRVSSAPHPCGFESLRLPTKKRSGSVRAWSAMFLGAGTEGFEPPTAGTKNRSSTVELRPSMCVAQKQLV